MRGLKMDLFEWTKQYIKFRDVMKREVKEIIEKNNHEIITEEKKENKRYLINDKIEEAIKQIRNEEKTIIVCSNEKENIKELIKDWNKVKNNKKLTIIFTETETNEKWLIHPNTHNKITDNLKEGLNTLYESIK